MRCMFTFLNGVMGRLADCFRGYGWDVVVLRAWASWNLRTCPFQERPS